jgi:hypothetical protein
MVKKLYLADLYINIIYHLEIKDIKLGKVWLLMLIGLNHQS